MAEDRLRIGSCRALAEMVRDDDSTADVVPCAEQLGHYPQSQHRAVTLDGREVGRWTDR